MRYARKKENRCYTTRTVARDMSVSKRLGWYMSIASLLLPVNGGCQQKSAGSNVGARDIGKNETKDISVVPYDAHWPNMFEAEKTAIVAALGEDCLCIHHIGSTSVPGLAAKPKIDIIAAAKNRDKAIAALEKVGYRYRGEWGIPLQAGFAKRMSDGNPIDVNLHMFFDANHPEIELNLRFRDYLRKNPAVRDEYARIKQDILADSSSKIVVKNSADGIFPAYTLRKAPFINEVLRKTGYDRLRALKANTKEHWEAIRKFWKQTTSQIRAKNNAEYFVFYKGVDIIGCSEVTKPSENSKEVAQKQAKVTMFELSPQKNREHQEEARKFFKNLLKEWCLFSRDSID